MKTLFGSSLCFFLLIAVTVSAQSRGTGGGGTSNPRPTTSTIPNTNTNMGQSDFEHPVFITGKVLLSGGGSLTESAAIQTICSNGSRRHIETYTDSRGNFSFEFKK